MHMKPELTRPALAAALLVTALAAAPPAPVAAQGTSAADAAAAQTGAGDEQGDATFFEAMDVNVVNVDVYVTGKDGEPVTDLTRDEFEVFEDGCPI